MIGEDDKVGLWNALKNIEYLRRGIQQITRWTPTLSGHYYDTILGILERFDLQAPAGFHESFCEKCHGGLLPGQNCVVRTSPQRRGGASIRSPVIKISCSRCMHRRRIPVPLHPIKASGSYNSTMEGGSRIKEGNRSGRTALDHGKTKCLTRALKEARRYREQDTKRDTQRFGDLSYPD